MSVDNLRRDHIIIKRLRDIANICSILLNNDENIPLDDIKELIIIIEEFIDKCHHTKEECYLFPKVKDLQEEIRALTIEHEFGRRVAMMIERYISKEDNKTIARLLNAYVTFLDTHMEREEKFFDMIGEYDMTDYEFMRLTDKMDKMKHRIDILEAKEWCKRSN
ncbi:MAG: hemerythrin domain-containing protein [Candidatus Nitrosocaldaceae archaeon]